MVTSSTGGVNITTRGGSYGNRILVISTGGGNGGMGLLLRDIPMNPNHGGINVCCGTLRAPTSCTAPRTVTGG